MVVVVLSGVSRVESTPVDRSVIAASVVRTGISEMFATVVVLPTPKPPAITIFTGSGGRSLDGFKSTNHPFQDLPVAVRLQDRAPDREVPQQEQVTGEHPDHA